MQVFIQFDPPVISVKIPAYQGLHQLYKKLHKECFIKKARNVDVTAFLTFWCVPKLAFGNVIFALFVYSYLNNSNYIYFFMLFNFNRNC